MWEEEGFAKRGKRRRRKRKEGGCAREGEYGGFLNTIVGTSVVMGTKYSAEIHRSRNHHNKQIALPKRIERCTKAAQGWLVGRVEVASLLITYFFNLECSSLQVYYRLYKQHDCGIQRACTCRHPGGARAHTLGSSV